MSPPSSPQFWNGHPQTTDIPVIVVSMIEDRALAFSLGVADYLVKPVDPDLLIAKLRQLERPGRRQALVVDDEPDAVEIIGQILTEEGYTVRTAYGGQEAIGEIERDRPDILFLDIMMPHVSGFDVLDHLADNGYLEDMATVVVTAKDLTPEEMDFLNQKVASIVLKGHFRGEEFVEALKQELAKIEV